MIMAHQYAECPWRIRPNSNSARDELRGNAKGQVRREKSAAMRKNWWMIVAVAAESMTDS